MIKTIRHYHYIPKYNQNLLQQLCRFLGVRISDQYKKAMTLAVSPPLYNAHRRLFVLVVLVVRLFVFSFPSPPLNATPQSSPYLIDPQTR